AEVERLGTLLEKWNELAHAWEEGFAMAATGDLALRAEYLERVARLYDEKLEDPARAQGAWRRLYDLDPSNAARAQTACAALAALYERAGAWTDLVAILRQQVEWAPELSARRELLLRCADLQENQLADPTAAVATYREVLEQEPECTPALDALERLYATGTAWRDQIGILKRRIELARRSDERRQLLWRIAEIQQRELEA